MSRSSPSLVVLGGLARAVAFDDRLRVVEGDPGRGWSLDSRSGCIRCDPDDLQQAHADDVRSLVCHEAAHWAVTRYPVLVPPSVLAEPGVAPLLNALEDCRIETWLARRFPGTAAWIRRTNERLLPVSLEVIAEQPLAHQFCLGAILGWWQDQRGEAVVWPDALAQEVVDALDATHEARAAARARQPPADVLVAGDSGYSGSGLARRFAASDARQPPDAFERAVRMSAWAWWSLVHRSIRPAYQPLVDIDLATRPTPDAEEAAFVRRLRGLAPGGYGLAGARRGARGSGQGQGQPGGASGRALLPTAPSSTYEATRQRVEPLIARTCRALLPLLTRGRIPTWSGTAPSGGRVDLRAVMQGDADPRRRHRVWQRKTLPVRRDPVVHLLVDLSGSMAGDRIEHAFAGVVLLCEVMHRLQIPFAVSGFQDRRIPVKRATDPLDRATRERVGSLPLEVVGRRPGGCNRPEHNHDGPALLDAAHELLGHPAQEHWLWVVSDGLPTGPGDGAGALHAAVRRVVGDGRVRLVGLGLGPGTEHVASFFPQALPAMPLEDLPGALGGLVERLVASAL